MSVQDVITGMKALDEARDGYAEALAYASGSIPERVASEAQRRLLSEVDEYRFRLAAVPIEVLADRVQVTSVVSERSEAADPRLEQIRAANGMEHIEPHMIREMFTLGDAYAMVWPVERDEEERPDELRAAGVEITYLSALGTRAVYHEGDPLRPLYVMRRWRTTVPEGRYWNAELWYVDRVEAWVTDLGANGLDINAWHPYAEDSDGFPVPAVEGQTWPVAHDFGEIPIKHARNGLPYGRPEHIDAYGPQDAITKTVITQVYTIEEHGWPERLRLMDDAQVLDAAREAVSWGEPGDAPDATMDGIASAEVTALRRGAGTETKYFGTKSVQVVQPPDPGRLIEPIEQWIRMMATVTKTPLYEFDQRTGQQLSGVAYERADRPLKAKEKDRKRYLLGFFREVYGLALAMVGVEPGTLMINWSLPEVTTDPEFWTTAETRERMGIPTEQILAEANYDPDLIQEWLDNQAEATTLDKRIARLQAMAEALQAMGTAISLGAVDPVTGQRIVTTILSDAIPAGLTIEPRPLPGPPVPPAEDEGGPVAEDEQ
jgi:hypothetical protein